MLLMLIVNIVMFIIGLFMYCLKWKHLLIMLLSLEFLVLAGFLMLINYLLLLNTEFYMLMIYMIMCVCESVVGLSLLVLLIRSFGNDYIMSLNLLW
uniref:NADH-ubiquinone oxidoreductase chain 4L n=1 Tax=Cucujoidea sp. 34 KM-2017 TaxID=2219372 RepID=A0A346RHR3_9CUCU|nr:NADH dehydrogenase subunit 4L [Cucujoidea sp. 34 KM-2017]